MKELIGKDEIGMFVDNHDVALVDSRYVARYFEKRHDHVIRDIRELDCSEEFRLSNFGESSYKNDQGKKQPCYYMTRDGFVFLAMGYRGKKAAQFKEMYIKRFNKMEKHIQDLVAARMQCPLLTENIKLMHDNPKPYHYSNEFNMINRIVLEMPAKRFRREHGIKDGESIRPYLTPEQIEMISLLQNIDVGLVISIPEYEKRKQFLIQYKMNKEQRMLKSKNN